MSEQPQIFSDLALSRRLERAEAQSNADFVETRARLSPESGACWTEIAGAKAMFDGVGSPLTQTFGLGMFATPTAVDLAALEQFFQTRGADVFHEVSPLADAELWPLLRERGYQPIEFTSVMHRPVAGATAPRDGRVTARLMRPDETETWAQTAAEGWSEFTEFAPFMLELSRIGAQRANAFSFFAELQGQPIATAAMTICQGVALMAGASTIPAARKQGAQNALLNARLQHAFAQGCDIAMMCALPGSASQRNAERQGFRIAYTRIKWQFTPAKTSPNAPAP
jgi:GNAT superfamily N-acetyltransferase